MGRSQRVKGATAEREVANVLKARGHDEARRTAPMQTHLGGKGGFADVAGLPGVHLEVKRQETLHMDAWSAQAESECGEATPVVVYRRSRQPWRVSMRLDDFLDLYERGTLEGLGMADTARMEAGVCGPSERSARPVTPPVGPAE